MFKTQYSADRPRPKAGLGCRDKILYAPEFDDDGRMHLVESGKEDLYGYIQSHKDSVDINVLLKRYQNGDAAALNRAQAFFMDTTDLPTTHAEWLNRVNQGRQFFDSLPAETRARFGNDFNRFIASMDSPDFAKLIGLDVPGDGSVETAVETPAQVVQEVANES